MKRTSVHSSNIEEIGYDPETQVMEILFRGGTVYQYSGIHPDLHKSFMLHESKGGFFYAHIKNRFPSIKLEEKWTNEELKADFCEQIGDILVNYRVPDVNIEEYILEQEERVWALFLEFKKL